MDNAAKSLRSTSSRITTQRARRRRKDEGRRRWSRAISDQNRICAGDQSRPARPARRPLLWRSRSGCHPMPPGLSEMRWQISREQNLKCATKTAPQNEGMCRIDWTNENIGLERSMRVPLKRRKRGGCSLSSFVFIKAVQGDSGGLTARLG